MVGCKTFKGLLGGELILFEYDSGLYRSFSPVCRHTKRDGRPLHDIVGIHCLIVVWVIGSLGPRMTRVVTNMAQVQVTGTSHRIPFKLSTSC